MALLALAVLAAGLWVAMPGASAHDPVTETYQERVAPYTESYTVPVQVGTEAYQVRVAPYTASHTYYTTETRTTCAYFGCVTLDVSVPHTVTWQVYNYETRTRPVYETQTRTRTVYNYATRTRTVHDPHYEPPPYPEPCCLTPAPPVEPGPGDGDGNTGDGLFNKVIESIVNAAVTLYTESPNVMTGYQDNCSPMTGPTLGAIADQTPIPGASDGTDYLVNHYQGNYC
ncbi:MAG: hypothetical protein OXT07_06710 [bacterium]|nr:hypothetical protein [bacterium]